MWESAQWIRIPPDELKQKQIYHGDLGGRFAYFRCECHAWSALPLYTFIHTLAGIRQENGVIVIRPHLLGFPDLSGSAATPLGNVQFVYRRTDDGTWQYRIRLPENVHGLLIMPSDKRIPFSGELRYAE